MDSTLLHIPLNKVSYLKSNLILAMMKDKLGIIWVHTYYLKGKRSWEVEAKQASWIVRKILQVGRWLAEAGLNVNEEMGRETYSIHVLYNQLRGKHYKVLWKKLICNNQGSPKWKFILYLVVHKRLYTKDRLSK